MNKHLAKPLIKEELEKVLDEYFEISEIDNNKLKQLNNAPFTKAINISSVYLDLEELKKSIQKLIIDLKDYEYISSDRFNLLLDNLKGVLLEKDINFLNKLFEKNNNKAIPIIQYDLSGKEIARFDSMNKAKQATGISLVQIARCVHGEIKQASGYIFKQQ